MTDDDARRRLIVAIDTADLGRARALAEALDGRVGALKLGLEFFAAHGPEGVARVVAGAPLFLDLKLHDIPNTLAGAVRAVAPLAPALLTVHAAAGEAALRAAREAAPAATRLLGVTVLTSLDDAGLAATGVAGGVVDQVLRLAGLARDAGLPGVVASAREIAPLRSRFGDDLVLVVPGIRPAGAPAGDQRRVMTPAEAMAAGADYLVIGRPITAASDPAAAAAAITAEMAAT